MQGQSNAFAMIAMLPVIVVSILITFWVYGSVSIIVPHDQTIHNETMCTTCINSTLYTFDNIPVVNDSTLLCYNASNDLMTRGVNSRTCLGYNTINLNSINITNSSAQNDCQISDVVCTYTFNEANTNQQGFWNVATTNINSSFSLVSVAPIVFAAVVIVAVVFLLGRQN